jgi:hypothetical protein
MTQPGGSGGGDASAANQTTEIARLDSLIAKDYATQTTLALIKAKTDNIDVLLSTRTKPADAQHVIVDSAAANASTNVAQLAGTATSVNSGTKDAGTLRVVLATDQPALTNKLLVTPDSVALPANQSVNVAQVGGTTAGKRTYRASTIIPLVAAVTVNVPFFNIIGSATTTVKVTRIRVSGMTLTAVGYFTINVEKLSTASTAGTSTTLVATSLDSSDTAVTAVVKAYTVAPTKGTLVGTLASYRSLWQVGGTPVANAPTPEHIFNFGDMWATKGVTLRGVAQELALTFPVVLASAGTLAVDIEWTEE